MFNKAFIANQCKSQYMWYATFLKVFAAWSTGVAPYILHSLRHLKAINWGFWLGWTWHWTRWTLDVRPFMHLYIVFLVVFCTWIGKQNGDGFGQNQSKPCITMYFLGITIHKPAILGYHLYPFMWYLHHITSQEAASNCFGRPLEVSCGSAGSMDRVGSRNGGETWPRQAKKQRIDLWARVPILNFGIRKQSF